MTIRNAKKLTIIAALLLVSGGTFAASNKIAYQGQLREQGVPVTADKSMVFRIFTSSTSGAAVWTSGAQTVSVVSGLFRTLLQPTAVDWESPLYLEVEVEGTTLSPREELTAASYAIDSLLVSGKAYTSAASAPSSPSAGDLWFDTSSGLLFVWSGSTWAQASGGAGGGNSIAVQKGGSVIDANASVVNFSSSAFTVTSGPSGQANVGLTASQPGTINASTNPVDWTELKNVPAEFADGVDNTGGGSPAVDEEGSVVDGAAATFNFAGANFNVTSSPAGQANISLDASSATLQGNTFNVANKLVRLDGSGNLPAAGAANLTNVAASQLTGLVPNASVDSSSVTKQGNTFNAANKLVQLDGSGNLPAAGAANLTNVAASQLTGLVPNASVDSSSVTKQGNTFNAANKLVQLDVTGGLTISGWTPILKHLSGTSNVSYGTLSPGNCDEQTVTVTGAVAGDTVYIGLPSTFAQSSAWQTWTAYVSANDTVTLRRCNVDGRLTPASLSALSAATVRADVWRH